MSDTSITTPPGFDELPKAEQVRYLQRFGIKSRNIRMRFLGAVAQVLANNRLCLNDFMQSLIKDRSLPLSRGLTATNGQSRSVTNYAFCANPIHDDDEKRQGRSWIVGCDDKIWAHFRKPFPDSREKNACGLTSPIVSAV